MNQIERKDINRIIKKNKSAQHHYKILDKYVAGIVLQGHEVKAIKNNRVSIQESNIRIKKNGDAHIFHMSVPLYKKANYQQNPDYEPQRTRKILLKKRQLAKLWEKTHQWGYNIIVLNIFENSNHLIKLTIALAKKKKKADKRQKQKERDMKRQAEKEMKRMGY